MKHYLTKLAHALSISLTHILERWNAFFDPQQIVENPPAAMPDPEIDHIAQEAILKQVPVQITVQLNGHKQILSGRLFIDRRHTDVLFLTRLENSNLTRIIFKQQIQAISLQNQPQMQLRKTS
ncbi:hypothetical protein LFYK43_05750 [Ligilactobacillus salitolerans]|uniref:Uncharacterized protein n=1 Tax=Ligilactobacillus salitolerans TaxID=1808352 RepID=A0A401IRG5_9LACO|nr:hypothetical protein [Ligilactobacillus salitolerans]GBG94116.1 hypothetical protein LFYK43_05750 [Ligilactobacillus salitolerans]